jgi:pantoate--beta-alanine ligase
MTFPTRQSKACLRTVRTIAELRAETGAARRSGARIGLVPTMGALHEGHLSLIRRAREQCELVVVSVFVNPAQFDEQADLARYPRREREDAELAAAAGADVLFAPAPEEVYPEGFATTVEVGGVGARFEGEVRGAGHFRGVATVVTKLLSMAAPDVAYFGQKDAQQLVLIRRLVADLNLPVRIEGLPTVREPDGLAMSSRNALLSSSDRTRALALPAALEAARHLLGAGERDAGALAAAASAAMRARGVDPQYAAIVDPRSFEPLERVEDEALLAVAARVGDVRLIDNTILAAAPAPQRAQPEQGEAISQCSA